MKTEVKTKQEKAEQCRPGCQLCDVWNSKFWEVNHVTWTRDLKSYGVNWQPELRF